jgi:hypothetical protein
MTEKKKSNLTLLAIICCIVCLTLGILYGLQKEPTVAPAASYPTGVDVSNSPNFSETPYEPSTQGIHATLQYTGSPPDHATPLLEHYPRKLDSKGGYARAASF